MDIKARISQSLINGAADEVKSLVAVGLQIGLTAEELIDTLILAIEAIGEKFKENRLYIPDVLMASRAFQAGLYVLEPLMKGETKGNDKIRVVIGTVAGDLHDIGKKLVFLTLEAAGMEVIDLGIDVPPERFVQGIRDHKPHIVGMSALLTITMPMLKKSIEAIEAAGLRNQVKVIVGGSPVTREYAEEIGADGYAEAAYQAVDLIKSLLTGK